VKCQGLLRPQAQALSDDRHCAVGLLFHTCRPSAVRARTVECVPSELDCTE
jgi:hypothetical protein